MANGKSNAASAGAKRVLRGKFKFIDNWESQAAECCFNASNLAARCDVSLRHLQRHFQQQYGLKLQKWLNELRLSKAYELLREANSVKEVTFELGYKQVSHFSREFKRYHGIPPSLVVREGTAPRPTAKTTFPQSGS